MIEVKVDEKGIKSSVNGTLETLVIDFARMTNVICRQIRNANPECGEAFRETITEILCSPQSAVWDTKKRSSEVVIDMSGGITQ